MKKRTFLTTLFLFLLFFYAAIFLVSIIMLKDRLDAVRNRCLAEHYVIASSMIKEMQALESLEELGDGSNETFAEGLSTYTRFSQTKKMSLAVYQQEELLFSSMGEDPVLDGFTVTASGESTANEGKREVFTRGKNPAFLYVSGQFPSPYQEYALVYRYDMSEELSSWRQVKGTMYLCGMFFSILLAMCLLLLLGRLFRPLKEISEASRDIAEGKDEKRIPVKGKDEIAEMANSFNHMADEIGRQMGELREAAEQKQHFIDNFAHELRTPLTAIYGYAEYIQRAAITEEDKIAATGYILSECRRMQEMAYQLLELATMRENQIEQAAVSVSDLFESVKKTMFPKAAAKRITISYSSTIEELFGNRGLLENLLINLIDNAVKASPPDSRIVVQAEQKNLKKLLIVQDWGKGMSPEQLSHIREAFYRIDKARSRAEGGTGLGLSICDQIAEIHGAELRFDSRPGDGTQAMVIFTA